MIGPADRDPKADTDVLSRLVKDLGPAVVGRIIDLFLEHGPDRLEAVRAGMRDADMDAAEAALHSIKSSAAMLGIHALAEVCGRAERLAREGPGPELTALIGSFESTFAEAIVLLRARRDELASRD